MLLLCYNSRVYGVSVIILFARELEEEREWWWGDMFSPKNNIVSSVGGEQGLLFLYFLLQTLNIKKKITVLATVSQKQQFTTHR